MTTLNNYYNEIRSDIAKEFGFSAIGIGVPKPQLPVRVAQRIANKYPSDFSKGRFNAVLNPKAVAIAQRYVRLMQAGVIK